MIRLFEHINNEKLLHHITIDYKLYENAGLYDGIEELSKFLTNKIKSHQEKKFIIKYNYDDIQLRKFHNIFFNQIIISCVRDKNHSNIGEYISNDVVDFNISTNRFNFVRINLELTINNNSQEVYQSLLHELTHAWDDYNSYKNGTTSIKQAGIDINYSNIINLINNGNDANELIGKIFYFLSDIEINAFMEQFAGYLYNYLEDNTIIDPHKAYNIIKDSDIYKNYESIGSILCTLNNNDTYNETKLLLTNKYNKLHNTTYSSHKVFKILNNQYKRIMRRIESNIGKLCIRYIKELVIK